MKWFKSTQPCTAVCLLVCMSLLHTGGAQEVASPAPASTSSSSSSSSTNSSAIWHVHIHADQNDRLTFNVSHDEVTLEESYFFIERLFKKYGNKELLTYQNLEKIFWHLGIGEYIGPVEEQSHKDSTHEHDHGDHADHSDHAHRRKREIAQQKPQKTKRSLGAMEHIHTLHHECLSLQDMLQAFHLVSTHHLTKEQFALLCPAIVYQLDSDVCMDKHKHETDGSITHSHEHTHTGPGQHGGHSHNHDHVEAAEVNSQKFDISRIPAKVWGFSTVAVLIISAVGLLGVAVIPIMQKVFYNHLLQFLVALAVGALSGDALLHLLPHSIMGAADSHKDHGADGGHDSHNHSAGAWKGLSALAGILFFFITERLLTIITIIKRNKKSNKQSRKKRCEKFCDIESNKKAVGAKLSHRHDDANDGCDRTVMMVHPNKALKSYADAAHDEFMHQCDEDDAITPMTDVSIADGFKSLDGEDDAEAELMELAAGGESGHSHLPAVTFNKGHSHNGGHSHSATPARGHSHGGHSHSVPNSVSAVAWMVILGDGIHNFSDGLAIGAAFANSMTGGFSTSVAVFCHELPHEIGDFAVLLRAGMSAKQAIMYNCMSSILCFFGMLIGVAIGNITSASLWIFAIVGGMFLYIALVDMLPEMSSMDSQKGENPFFHLLIQVLGILIGAGIMLIIAVFEEDIKKAFD